MAVCQTNVLYYGDRLEMLRGFSPDSEQVFRAGA